MVLGTIFSRGTIAHLLELMGYEVRWEDAILALAMAIGVGCLCAILWGLQGMRGLRDAGYAAGVNAEHNFSAGSPPPPSSDDDSG